MIPDQTLDRLAPLSSLTLRQDGAVGSSAEVVLTQLLDELARAFYLAYEGMLCGNIATLNRRLDGFALVPSRDQVVLVLYSGSFRPWFLPLVLTHHQFNAWGRQPSRLLRPMARIAPRISDHTFDVDCRIFRISSWFS